MHVTLFENTPRNAKVSKRLKRGTKSSNFGASFFVPILELRSPKMSLFVIVVVLSPHPQVNKPTNQRTHLPTNQTKKQARKQANNQPSNEPTNHPTNSPTNQPTKRGKKRAGTPTPRTTYTQPIHTPLGQHPLTLTMMCRNIYTANPYFARAASPHSHHEVAKYMHICLYIFLFCLSFLVKSNKVSHSHSCLNTNSDRPRTSAVPK